MPQRWDVIVVGAGPAGCAAALAAHRAGARTVLLDRAAFPRDKPCGDGIAAEVFDVLAGLGVDTAALTDGYPPVTRLRVQSPGGVLADRPHPRPVRVIPRRVLDARLLEQTRRLGVEFRTHTVRRVTPDGEVDDLRAGAVVGADGSESVVRRALGIRRPRPRSVALAFRGYVETAERETQSIVMTREHWPAYAWLFPDGTGRANVGYGEVLRGAPPARAAMLARMRQLLPGLGEIDALRAHRLPLTPGRPPIPDGRVVLAGDAQSLIDPLTGEGIYTAVRSGALAGEAAAAGRFAGAAYRAAMRRALGAHLRTTDVVAALTRRPGVVDAGVAGASVSQRAFDDVVRMGVADGVLTPRLALAVARGALRA